jgi:hypothetical protein
MGLRPTHRDESALLGFIDSKPSYPATFDGVLLRPGRAWTDPVPVLNSIATRWVTLKLKHLVKAESLLAFVLRAFS